MQKKHLCLAVMVTAIWGLNFPITKLGLAEIDPLLLTALRFSLAAVPWVFVVKRPQVRFRWLAGYGLIFGVAMWALINQGIALGVPPGSASLLIQLSAFFTLGWGVLWFGESLNRPQLIGICLAALGLFGVLVDGSGTVSTVGLALVIASALAWSIGNVLIKKSKVQEIFAFVVWASLFPPIPLLLLTWLAHGSAPFTALPAQLHGFTLFSLAFQVYGATLFCYWGWNLLLREYPVSQVAPLSLLIPLFGIVSSMLILGQWPSALGLASMLLILLALAVGARPGKAVPAGRQRGGGRRENLQR